VQGDDVAGVLVEGVVLPALVDESLHFRRRVVQFNRLAHLSRCTGIVWRRYNPLFVMLRIWFETGRRNILLKQERTDTLKFKRMKQIRNTIFKESLERF
jgi:hypothetical protein